MKPPSNFFKTALLILATALVSCDQPKPNSAEAEKIDQKLLVSCNGIGEVKLSDNYQDLEKKFKAANLSAHENSNTGQYTSIWEGRPKQVNVYWQEKAAPYVHIRYIETVSPDAPYTADGPLKIGMTMKEVQQVNTGMPLTFNNPLSGSDAGLVSSFNNGEIATKMPCIGGYVEVARTRNIDEPTMDKFKQEPVVESTHILMAERMDVIFARYRVNAK